MPTICHSMCPAEESVWTGLSIGPGQSWECMKTCHLDITIYVVLMDEFLQNLIDMLPVYWWWCIFVMETILALSQRLHTIVLMKIAKMLEILHVFLVILKRPLQNYQKFMQECLLITVSGLLKHYRSGNNPRVKNNTKRTINYITDFLNFTSVRIAIIQLCTMQYAPISTALMRTHFVNVLQKF